MPNRSRTAPLLAPVLLIFVILVSTYAAISAGLSLGFRFGIGVYLVIGAVLAASISIEILFLKRNSSANRELAFLRRHALSILVVASLMVRIAFVFYSSINPDEYGAMVLLQMGPLSNIPLFLVNYDKIAGAFVAHPPLSFLLMSVGYVIYPSVIGPRMISALLSTASVVVVYYLARDLTESQEVALFSAAIYGLVPHTVLFLSLATTNSAAIFFGVTSLWLFVRSLKKPSVYLGLLSGITFGLALWSRMWEPFFWAFIAFMVVLFTSPKRRFPVNLGLFGLMTIVGSGIYGLWALINPYSFSLSSPEALWVYLMRFLNPSGYELVTKNPTVTATTATPHIFNIFTHLIPQFANSWMGPVSFSDIIAQLPLWVTPVVILLCIAGIVSAFKRRKRLGIVEACWVFTPLLLMIPYLRDIRYLLVAAPAYSLLAAVGLGLPGSRHRRVRLQAVVLGSVIIFLAIAFPVAQQTYGGVSDASFQLQRLGLEEAVVMTNAPNGLQYYLPHTQILYLNPAYNQSVVLDTLQHQHVKAVMVLHTARGTWPNVSPDVLTVIRNHFNGHLSGGPSDFSWYEIFYDPANG